MNFVGNINIDLPPSVFMSQYTVKGCMLFSGSIQYSLLASFSSGKLLRMSLQDLPGRDILEPINAENNVVLRHCPKNHLKRGLYKV